VSESVLSYPPPDHVLRELGLETELRPDGVLLGYLPVTDAVRSPSGIWSSPSPSCASNGGYQRQGVKRHITSRVWA
jgi:hypothetical protein